MKYSVWRELVDVPGPAEFFVLLNDRIRTTDDRELLTTYLQVLAGDPSTEDDSNIPYIQNSDDRHWIHQQITQIQTNQRGQEKGKSKRKPSGAKIPKTGLTTQSTYGIDTLANPQEADSDLLCKCLESVLKGFPEFVKEYKILSDQEDTQPDLLLFAKQLLAQSNEERDFPLRRFKHLLLGFRNSRKHFVDSVSRQPFAVMIDLLRIASFPLGDMQRMESSMKDVLLHPNPKEGACFIDVRNQLDAEKLLLATRLKLCKESFEDWEITQLLRHDVRSNDQMSVIFEKMLVIPEPTLPPDNTHAPSYYAKSCLSALGYDVSTKDWTFLLQDFLKDMSKADTLVSMFIARDHMSAISILQQEFPNLLLIVLADEDANRYSQIAIELSQIEVLLKKILVANLN